MLRDMSWRNRNLCKTKYCPKPVVWRPRGWSWASVTSVILGIESGIQPNYIPKDMATIENLLVHQNQSGAFERIAFFTEINPEILKAYDETEETVIELM